MALVNSPLVGNRFKKADLDPSKMRARIMIWRKRRMVECKFGIPKKKCLIENLMKRDVSINIDGEWIRLRDVFKSSEFKENGEI